MSVEWIDSLVGIWLLSSPWILGFAANITRQTNE